MKQLARLCTTGLIVAGVLAPANVIAAAPGRAADRGLPANGRILFTHCEDATGCQIYTANPDGSAIEQVTSAEGEAFDGDWSPDGSRIAYVSYESGDSAIWIVDADGSNPSQLTPNDPDSDNLSPRFSPEGDWILFTNCEGFDCNGGIYAVRPDGSQMHAVTPNSHDSYNLAVVSPDGSRMAFMRWHVGGVKMAVYVSHRDGSHQRRISPPRLQGWYPDWSPTGRRIVFADEVYWDRPTPSLWTVRPDGGGLRVLTDPPPGHADYRATYSPDGRTVIFESDRRYGDVCCSDLFTVPAAGGKVQRVHLPFDAYEVRWGTAPLQAPAAVARTRWSTAAGGNPCDRIPALTRLRPCALGVARRTETA